MTTVALGEFGPILRLGLRAVLADAGCLVLADGATAAELAALAAGRRIDAVLLSLDAPAGDASALAHRNPRIRVIECSADRAVIRLREGHRATELALTTYSLRTSIGV